MDITLEPTPATRSLMALINTTAPSIVRSAKFSGLNTASQIFTLKSKQEAPVDTQYLRRSILYKVELDGSSARVYVDPNVKYAIFQEMGTGIYGYKRTPITPKKAKFLRFKARSGQIVYAKSVKGTPAKWYMRKGSEEVLRSSEKINQVIYNELKKGLQL